MFVGSGYLLRSAFFGFARLVGESGLLTRVVFLRFSFFFELFLFFEGNEKGWKEKVYLV